MPNAASLPIQDILPRIQYLVAGLPQAVFNVPFYLFAEGDISVYNTPPLAVPNDNADILQLGVDYTVILNNGNVGATITLTVPAPIGSQITLVRTMADQRLGYYTPGGGVSTDGLNTDFESLVLMVQQAQLYNQRLTPTYAVTTNPVLPDVIAPFNGQDMVLPILGANQAWVKNAANTAIVAQTIPTAPPGRQFVSYVPPSITNRITIWGGTDGLLSSSLASIDNLGNATGFTTLDVADITIQTGLIASANDLGVLANGNLILDTIGAGVLRIEIETNLRFGNSLKFWNAGNTNYVGFSTFPGQIVSNDYTWPGDYPPAANYFLTSTIAGGMNWQFIDPLATGDFSGPAGATPNALVRFDGNTGKLGKNSLAILTDAGVLSGITQLNVDNLRFDGNIISSTNPNGDVSIVPQGTGRFVSFANFYLFQNKSLIFNNNNISSITFNGAPIYATQNYTFPLAPPAVDGYILSSTMAGQWSWIPAPGGGTGDVVGPAGATDNALARFDGNTGKLIQSSNALLSDFGTLTLQGGLIVNDDIFINNISNLSFSDGVNTISFRAFGGPFADQNYVWPDALPGGNNYSLTSDMAGNLSWLLIGGGGGGNVSGPGVSTQNALVRWNNLTGTLVADSDAILDNAGNLSITGTLTVNTNGVLDVVANTTFLSNNLANGGVSLLGQIGGINTSNIDFRIDGALQFLTVNPIRISAANGSTQAIEYKMPTTPSNIPIGMNFLTSSPTGDMAWNLTSTHSLAFNIVAHGFVVGKVLAINGAGNYILANAMTTATAEVVGIVSVVIDANNFILSTGGYINTLAGLTPGSVYYLNYSNMAPQNGTLTAVAPVTPGFVNKPVMIALTATTGLIINQRGIIV